MENDRGFCHGYILLLSLLSPTCMAVFNSSAELQLYQDLFVHYNHVLRPVSKPDYFKEILVTARFGLVQIEKMNEKDQQLTSHGWISLSWRDDLLTWDPSYYSGARIIVVPAEKVWLPEISPLNDVHGSKELAATVGEDTRVRVYYDGSVLWSPALKWDTGCEIDVKDFPYDTQHCEIKYTNWMYTANYVNFTAVPQVDMNQYSPNVEWQVLGTKAWTELETTTTSDVLPLVNMQISLKRDPTFFELNVLLPAMLLSFLMIPTFILPVESGEKISLGVTLMLAYSITLLMLTDFTPRAGTTPRLTILILICTVCAGLSIFINVVIINIHYHSPDKPVPHWVKSLILEKLACILCCMKCANLTNQVEPFVENEISIGMKRNESLMGKDDAIFEKDKESIGKNFSESDKVVNSLREHVEFFKAMRVTDDMIAENKDNWNKVSRVMDRLFLCVYIVLVTACIGGILCIKYSIFK